MLIVGTGGVPYTVPDHVAVAKDIETLSTKYVTFKNGSEALTAFKTDPAIYNRFLYVSSAAGNTIPDRLAKIFGDSDQYALFSFNAALYSADLRNPSSHLNEIILKRRLEDLPYPFNADTVKAYRDFFKSSGSYVITGVTYGAAYELVSPCRASSIRKDSPPIRPSLLQISTSMSMTTLQGMLQPASVASRMKESSTGRPWGRHSTRPSQNLSIPFSSLMEVLRISRRRLSCILTTTANSLLGRTPLWTIPDRSISELLQFGIS
jgi:hypothetical protein